MDIIRRIRDCIKKSSLTQKEIAAKLGISEDSMVRYLKGTSQFKLDMLLQLSEILQIPLEYMITGKSNYDLTKLEQELIEYFRKLPESEQMREIGRLEEKSERFSSQQEISSTSRTG